MLYPPSNHRLNRSRHTSSLFNITAPLRLHPFDGMEVRTPIKYRQNSIRLMTQIAHHQIKIDLIT